MAKEQSTSGGIHIGNVGRDAKLQAGGDLVAGDKTTTTSLSTGFQSEEQKLALASQLDGLRDALRELRAEIDAAGDLDADQKDELAAAVAERIKALREVKERVGGVEPGKTPEPAIVRKLGAGLEDASKMVDKLGALAVGSLELTKKLAELGAKYGPLLLSARHLFGLP